MQKNSRLFSTAIILMLSGSSLFGMDTERKDGSDEYPPHKYFSLSKSCPPSNRKVYEFAKTLQPEDCLAKAKELMKGGDIGALHYWEALITNKKADSLDRDEAVWKYSKYTENLIKFAGKDPWWDPEQLRFQYVKYLKILCSKKNVPEKFLHKAYTLLGAYYNPMERKHDHSSAVQAEEFFIKALSYNQCEPIMKANLLNDLGALYLEGYFGNDDVSAQKAYDYYQKIDRDETLPLEKRLESKLMSAYALSMMRNEKATLEERKTLTESLMNHPDISPSLLQEAQVSYHYLRILECDYVSFNKETSKAILVENSEALKKLFQNSKLDSEADSFAKLSYAGAVHRLILEYKDDRYKESDLLKILADLMAKENQLSDIRKAKTILSIATLMGQTKQDMSEILKGRKISALLDNIYDNSKIAPCLKDEAGIRKALLTAQNLIPTPVNMNKKQEIISRMLDALNDSTLNNGLQIDVLKETSKFIQSIYKNHNKTVGKIISILKNFLKVEQNIDKICEIKFILYGYYQAYGELVIKDEEARDYVLDLSQEGVPEALRIRIVEEDESSSTEEEDSIAVSKVETKPDTALHHAEVLPNTVAPVSTQIPDNVQAPVIAIPVPPVPIAPVALLAPPLSHEAANVAVVGLQQVSREGIQKQRNRERAERLLENLRSKHSKVTQQEVINMLRRLDYTFQPTQDNGLTIHLAHRTRNNKKGTPGVLNKGQKNSLTNVLEDALNQ